MNHPLGFSLTFYSFNLPLAATFHHFGICRAAFSQTPPPQTLIASSDRCSSPSLPLYFWLHTILPTLFSFLHLLFYHVFPSPAPVINHQLSSFTCHLFTSTIIPSPPLPSFASCSFSLAESCSVCLCSSLAVTDWFALCWFWWRRCWCFQDGEMRKVTGSTPAVVNWQCVDQTGLNQNCSPLSAAHKKNCSHVCMTQLHHRLSLVSILWLKMQL